VLAISVLSAADRFTSASSKSPSSMRVAFRFENGRWTAMPHNTEADDSLAKLPSLYPASGVWIIAFTKENR